MRNWNFGNPKKGLPWPNGADGNPVPPAFLVHLRALDLEAQIVKTMLESAEIPVIVQQPAGGDFGQIILGFSGTGVDLYIPQTLLDAAKALLDSKPFETELADMEEEEDV